MLYYAGDQETLPIVIAFRSKQNNVIIEKIQLL